MLTPRIVRPAAYMRSIFIYIYLFIRVKVGVTLLATSLKRVYIAQSPDAVYNMTIARPTIDSIQNTGMRLRKVARNMRVDLNRKVFGPNSHCVCV